MRNEHMIEIEVVFFAMYGLVQN